MKKFIKIFFILILFEGVRECGAQNLVPNYSFETKDTCPFSAGQIYYAQPWTAAVTNSSSDYFNSCSAAGAEGVPINWAGNQNAQNGSAYAGIVMYAAPIGTNWREYLQVQLTSTLIMDSCYHLIY